MNVDVVPVIFLSDSVCWNEKPLLVVVPPDYEGAEAFNLILIAVNVSLELCRSSKPRQLTRKTLHLDPEEVTL